MLFSNEQVAHFINRNFEPVWESVRSVPILRLDFGNGKVVTRTLNGNIATYVCLPRGEVLDVLPGIYASNVYLQQLDQFRLLANYIGQAGKESDVRLREYHQARLTALDKKEVPPHFVNRADESKRKIEGAIKAILVSKPAVSAVTASDGEKSPVLDSKDDLGSWSALVKDSELNETMRRRQIHARVAEKGMVRPDGLTKWLYKDVLHADLDDPYLGLGKLLFEGYVFKEEDKK